MEFLIKLIVFLPLISAIYTGLKTRRHKPAFAQLVTTTSTFIAALFSWIVLYKVVSGGNIYIVEIAKWISSGDFTADWSLRVDSLTAIMLTLVTTVSALVHLYSVGYMSHDPNPQRFMSYLSLFTFFMLVLVTSNNLLQLFVGWEGVGLCSYLLIGFWYKRPSANAAAMKAFLVNRVGDLALAVGLFACFIVFGTISYDDIFNLADEKSGEMISFFGYQVNAITLICVLLFIGCMGKSAQLGLHTWLPDAMEGPTPVSALIHAATMVTAGIFLVARMSPLYEMSEIALNMITIVGATTALFAATIAVTQNDIKKVIAYSTCSQLGYMFFACGVSAYAAGIFHLYTHGFFKALLFLSAGSVIHAMSDEQDMRKMGGIWKKIPLTYAMMIIGTLAITGFPYLSGYFSKDAILEAAFAAGEAGNKYAFYAFYMGLAAAFLTAFYSWRLIIMTFHGECRADKQVYNHVHESPKVMTIPLIILATGALLIGGVYASYFGIISPELQFWNGSIKEGIIGEKSIYEALHNVPSWVIWSPLFAGVIGFLLALILYKLSPGLPAIIAKIFSPVYKLLVNKYYFDELYNLVFVKPSKKVGLFFWKFIDAGGIDKFGPNGFARLSGKIADIFRYIQSGLIYRYSFMMMFGLIIMLGYFILRNQYGIFS